MKSMNKKQSLFVLLFFSFFLSGLSGMNPKEVQKLNTPKTLSEQAVESIQEIINTYKKPALCAQVLADFFKKNKKVRVSFKAAYEALSVSFYFDEPFLKKFVPLVSTLIKNGQITLSRSISNKLSGSQLQTLAQNQLTTLSDEVLACCCESLFYSSIWNFKFEKKFKKFMKILADPGLQQALYEDVVMQFAIPIQDVSPQHTQKKMELLKQLLAPGGEYTMYRNRLLQKFTEQGNKGLKRLLEVIQTKDQEEIARTFCKPDAFVYLQTLAQSGFTFGDSLELQKLNELLQQAQSTDDISDLLDRLENIQKTGILHKYPAYNKKTPLEPHNPFIDTVFILKDN